MADVTISGLTQGIPTGNALIPYSTGSSTLGVPVSAIFQNTSSLLIGQIISEYSPSTFRLGVNGGILLDGNITFSQDVKEYFIRVPTNGGAIRLRGNSVTGVDRRLQLGVIDNLGNWSSKMTVNDNSVDVNGDVNIDGYLTTNLARVFATRSAGNVGNNSVVIWNNVLVNKGNNYNSTTGRFTASKTGLYRVSAYYILGTGGSGTGSGNFNIRVNGTKYADSHVNHNDGWDNSSINVIVSLNVSDYIDCYLDNMLGNFFLYGSSSYNGFSIEQLP